MEYLNDLGSIVRKSTGAKQARDHEHGVSVLYFWGDLMSLGLIPVSSVTTRQPVHAVVKGAVKLGPVLIVRKVSTYTPDVAAWLWGTVLAAIWFRSSVMLKR